MPVERVRLNKSGRTKILYRVTFAAEDAPNQRGFTYHPSMQSAKQWAKEEAPHDQELGYGLEIEQVAVPTSREGLASFLNKHHTIW